MDEVLVIEEAEGRVSIAVPGPGREVSGLLAVLPEGTRAFKIESAHLPPGDVGTFVADFEAQTVAIAPRDLDALRAEASMPRATFAIAAATAGLISEQEAEDWAAGAGIPAIATTAIATLPEADRLAARIAVRTQAEIHRTDRLIQMMAADPNIGDAGADALFGIVAAPAVDSPPPPQTQGG